MRIRGVLFDLDGTLVDTNPTHVEAWRRAFAEHGYDMPTERIAPHIGMGGDHLVPALIPNDRAASDGDAIREAHTRHYLETARGQHLPTLPNAVELIQAVRGRGLSVALASSSQPNELRATLRSTGVDFADMADATTDGDDVERSKPCPDIVTAAAEQLGLPPAACVLVGDTPYDGQAATAVGARFWAVRTGGFSDADLLAAGADAVYDDAADLLANLDDALDLGNETPPVPHEEAVGAG